MIELSVRRIHILGLILLVIGGYGLFFPKVTSDDGALAITGAILVAASAVARRGQN